MTARDILQDVFDTLTSFLLDNVDENENWEDCYPELDDLRGRIGDILMQPLNLTNGVENET